MIHQQMRSVAARHPGGMIHQQMRSVAARTPQRGDTLVTAGRRPADTGLTAYRQRPRRGRTSADMLCCSQTPRRGDTLVTAGRRPADTATLPTDSVPGGVAHHSSVSQHPLVR